MEVPLREYIHSGFGGRGVAARGYAGLEDDGDFSSDRFDGCDVSGPDSRAISRAATERRSSSAAY